MYKSEGGERPLVLHGRNRGNARARRKAAAAKCAGIRHIGGGAEARV